MSGSDGTFSASGHGHSVLFPALIPVMIRLAPLVLALTVLPAIASGQQAKHPLGIDEYIGLKTVSDPQLSPDGQLVAFTESTASLEDNRSASKVWLVQVGSGDSWQATSGPGSDRAPRWSPDGKTLMFISTRDHGQQIWQLPIRGGEPTRVTDFASGISDFVWSPDGRNIYFTSDIKYPDSLESERRAGKYPTDARIWTDLFYRHWDEWRIGLRQHVFRLVIKDRTISDLLPIDRDVPPLALGGRDIALSPVGTEIALVFNPDSNVATSTNNDIFVMSPDGSSRQAITTNPANDNSPLYSPDGRYIAYLAMSVPGFESDRQQLMLYERATGRRIQVTPRWELSISAIEWLPDSKALIAEVEERGAHSFYRIEISGSKPVRLLTGGLNTDLRISQRGDAMVFLHQTATQPAEVYIAGTDGKGARALTRVNDEAMASIDVSPAESFGFTGALGDSVFGYLIKPPHFDASKKYPLIYLIHGGPQGSWLDQWHTRWNYALFASRGYVVAAVNFHGSTGYGQNFTNSISRHWGDYPYEDLMKGLDYLTALPYVDKTRAGAAGASYGGYMIYWLAGHTDRFRTLVAHDGIYNTVSMSGTTEELWFPINEFGGSQLSPAGRATMEKWSPANFIANWSTPMLVVHSQNDFRVDMSEGIQAFTALKLRGVPAKFLYFPDEDHFVARPRNRRLWWGTVLDWMDEYLRPTAPPHEEVVRKPSTSGQ
ncbi:MAG: S9 family peptidase [Gemmatimonadota bacterium]